MKNDEDDPFCGLNVKEDVIETYFKDVVKDKIQCRLWHYSQRVSRFITVDISGDEIFNTEEESNEEDILTMLQNHVSMKQWMLSLHSTITVSFPFFKLI